MQETEAAAQRRRRRRLKAAAAAQAERAPAPRPAKRERPPEADHANEAINLALGAIFVAIPKTGTTSVRDQIRPRGQFLVRHSHLDLMQLRDCLYVHLLTHALRRNRRFPSEGVATDAEIRAEAAETFRRSFKFSSVRNPWARAVSLYFRKEGVRIATRMSFAEFCDRHLHASDTCVYPTLHRHQIDWIVDETDRIAVDYVYRIEEFDRAVVEIRDRTEGRIALEPLQRNVNPGSSSDRYREMYDDRTRLLVQRRFERDIDEFKYVF